MNFWMSGLDFLRGKAGIETRSHWMPRRGLAPGSPAGEVHLVSTQVDVGVGEHDADLLEELGHELVGAVQDGVDWSEGAGGFGARVAGCEKVRLA